MPCPDMYPEFYNENDVRNIERCVRAELEPLLCEACTSLEEGGHLPDASPALQAWYKSHEECEKARVKYEAALKLNERERRLLGINLAVLEAEMLKKKSK